MGSGGCGEEQPELAVDLGAAQVFDNFVQGAHPRQVQVRVLLHEPGAVLALLLLHGFGFFALALAEG